MPLIDVPQRSPEWHEARSGKITASMAAACLGLNEYVGPLAAYNKILGLKEDQDNAHKSWGREFEQEAKEEYQIVSGNLVDDTGFWIHPTMPWLGASPDGLVGPDGMVECKCPQKLPDKVPIRDRIQCLIQMECTGRAWCDYFAWCRPNHWTQRIHASRGTASLLDRLFLFQEHFIKEKNPPPKLRKKLRQWFKEMGEL